MAREDEVENEQEVAKPTEAEAAEMKNMLKMLQKKKLTMERLEL